MKCVHLHSSDETGHALSEQPVLGSVLLKNKTDVIKTMRQHEEIRLQSRNDCPQCIH